MSKKTILKCLLTTFILFTGLFALPNISEAATWYVSTTGTDAPANGTGTGTDAWASIGYALTGSRVAKGDTVYVEAGSYTEDQAVVAVGAGDGNAVTVQNYNGASVTVLTDPSVASNSGVFFVNSIDMVWDGINFDNNNVAMVDKFIFGIYSTSTPVDFTFQNASIDGTRASGQIRLFDLYGSQPHTLTINKAEITNGGYIVEPAGTATSNHEINIYSSVIYNSYVHFFPTAAVGSDLTLLNNVFARASGYGFYLKNADTEVQAQNNIFLAGGSNPDTIWNLGTDYAVAAVADDSIFDVDYNYYYSEDGSFVLSTYGDIITSTQIVPSFIPEENHFVNPSFTTIGSDYSLQSGSLVAQRGGTNHPPDGTDINGASYGANDVGPYVNPTLTALPSLDSDKIGWHGASTMEGVGASGESTKAVSVFDALTDEDVTNYAMGGQFSRGMFFAIDQSIWTGREATVVFAIGANDMITPRAQQTNAQVADMVIKSFNKLDNAGIEPVYLGISSVMGSPPDNTNVDATYALVDTECSSQNWSCGHILDQFEFNGSWSTEYYDDIATDAHPNDDGHAIIARLAEYLFYSKDVMGSDKVDIGGGARVFADGKFRSLTTESGSTANFTVTPVGGVGAFTSGDVSAYLDIAITSWETAGDYNKEWTAGSSTGAGYSQAGSTVYTVTDLVPTWYYQFKLDGADSSAITSSACSDGLCQADSSGSLTFTYTGGYSTHTFGLTAVGNSSSEASVSAPTSLTATDNDDGVKIEWDDPASEEASEILIYRGVDPYPVDGASIASVLVGVGYYLDSDVEDGDIVTYQIRAKNDNSYSAYTDSVTLTVGSGDAVVVDDSTDDDSSGDEDTDGNIDSPDSDEESTDESTANSLLDLGIVTPDHWFGEYFDTLGDEESVVYAAQNDDLFLDMMEDIVNDPNEGMTREEALHLLLTLADYDVVESDVDTFTDVDESDAHAHMIEFAADNGLVEGYPDGSFGLADVVNRVEALKMITSFFGLDLDSQVFGEALLESYDMEENPFVDVDLEAWYAPYLIFAYSNEVVHGYDDGSDMFGPSNNITYAEFVKIATLIKTLKDS